MFKRPEPASDWQFRSKGGLIVEIVVNYNAVAQVHYVGLLTVMVCDNVKCIYSQSTKHLRRCTKPRKTLRLRFMLIDL